MKHELSLDRISIPRDSIATVSFDLRLWADNTLLSADFSTSFSHDAKTSVEGMTAQQLIDRERPKIVGKAQLIINKYKEEKQLESSGPVMNLVSDIDMTLTS